jgi:hypothetical protein
MAVAVISLSLECNISMSLYYVLYAIAAKKKSWSKTSQMEPNSTLSTMGL